MGADLDRQITPKAYTQAPSEPEGTTNSNADPALRKIDSGGGDAN